LAKWGIDSPLYKSKVLGEFPESSIDTLIPLGWIIRAQNKDIEPKRGAESKLGVDVARFGTDRSVIYHNHGGRFRIVSDKNGESTMKTAGRTIVAWREAKATDINVDGVGVGGGVVDWLDDEGYPVNDMQAGGGSSDPKRFINARAEWYWELRTRFENDEVDLDPDDEELAAQLSSLRYIFTKRGQIQIESKDDMRKRGMPSPDRADGLMLSASDPIETGVSDTIDTLH
jgi:hypothetical protein